MILADTSVWVDFLRGATRASGLAVLLEGRDVLVHPWVRAELALGRLGPRRGAILADLGLLPPAPLLGDEEVLEMIEARSLAGRGIGWVDAHLLASAIAADTALWTFDRPLADAARRLELDTR